MFFDEEFGVGWGGGGGQRVDLGCCWIKSEFFVVEQRVNLGCYLLKIESSMFFDKE